MTPTQTSATQVDSDVAKIAAGLTEAERRAMIPLTFFSDAVGESLLAKGLFASRDGWPMAALGGRVSDHVQAHLKGTDQ